MHFVRSLPAFAILYAIFFSYGIGEAETPKQEIYLSENIQSGARLKFSDGSVYEIAPQDRDRAQWWVTPFTANFSSSNDSSYPVKITNTLTGSSVLAKKIS